MIEQTTSNFEDLDPQDLIAGIEHDAYNDPTPTPVGPDDPDYVEPWTGATPVTLIGEASRQVGACYICGDRTNHDGVPHNVATGETRFRSGIISEVTE